MIVPDGKPDHPSHHLRDLAEQRIREQPFTSLGSIDLLSVEEIKLKLHELQVHQIELEMQNEELRRAQAEIDLIKSRYFSLYDLAPVGYVTLIDTGRIKEANLTFATLLGTTRKALCNQLFSRFIHHDDQDIFYGHQMQLTGNGAAPACELRIKREDGSTFWAHLTTSLAKDNDSANVAFRVVISDISERKRVEGIQKFLAHTSAGAPKQQFFHDLVKFLAHSLAVEFVAIGRLHRNGLAMQPLVSWNDGQFEEYTSHPLPEPVRNALMEHGFCCHSGQAMAALAHDPLVRGLGAQSYIGATLFDHAGLPIGVLIALGRAVKEDCLTIETTCRIVADRAAGELKHQQAVSALRTSEERLKLALDAISEAVWDWDYPGGSVYVSRRFYSLIQSASVESLTGVECFCNNAHPDDVPALREAIDQHLGNQSESIDTDFRVPSPTGATRWLKLRGRVVEWDSDNRPVRLVGTLADTTEQKLAAEAQKRLESQLQQAQKMEAIGTLAGGIAHDFNNILAAIVGFTEIAKYACLPDSTILGNLEKVLQAAERASGLVKQILSFSRQGNTANIALELSHPVKEAIKLLRPILPTTIVIKHNIQAESSMVLADPIRIHQIVMNLCTNAFHAMEQKGGELSILLRNRTLSPQDLHHQPQVQAGNFVELAVTDTGPGIAQEIREKIFEPYFTTKEMGKGTGLGLAIVHGIVSSLGGFVECESTVGQGTTFHVYFPAIEGVQVKQEKVEAPCFSGSEHILYVDDEPFIAELGQQILEQFGYKVTTRTSSIDALAIFQNQPDSFDVVITDQTMPTMTGIELAERVHKIRPNLPIILCTGYSSLVNEEQVLARGIQAFITKPFTQKSLTEVLRKTLDQEARP